MNHDSDILTGQFVRIEQTPAMLSERIGAVLIDWVVLMAYCYAVDKVTDFFHISNWDALYVLIIPVLLYQPLCETFMGGQTVGKHLLGLRVVMDDGTSPGVGSFLLRWLIMPIDLMFFAAFFSILVTTRRQRLGDLAAGTMVIRLKTYGKMRVSLDEFAFAQPDYRPVFEQARNLTPRQAEVLSHALADRSTNRSRRLRELAATVSTAMGVDQERGRDDVFLAQMLKDYRYYDLHSF